MKLYPYIPTYYDTRGMTFGCLEVNSKEELLQSKLVRKVLLDGGIVCFEYHRGQSYLMALFEKTGPNWICNDDGCTWTVLSLVHNNKDAKQLAEWLPSYDRLKEQYSRKQAIIEAERDPDKLYKVVHEWPNVTAGNNNPHFIGYRILSHHRCRPVFDDRPEEVDPGEPEFE